MEFGRTLLRKALILNRFGEIKDDSGVIGRRPKSDIRNDGSTQRENRLRKKDGTPQEEKKNSLVGICSHLQ
jgi:hypothetical protein